MNRRVEPCPGGGVAVDRYRVDRNGCICCPDCGSPRLVEANGTIRQHERAVGR